METPAGMSANHRTVFPVAVSHNTWMLSRYDLVAWLTETLKVASLMFRL